MIRRVAVLAVAAAILAGPASERALAVTGFEQNGIAFPAWYSGVYPSSGARTSLQNLASTGATWVQIVKTAYQPRYTSTSISWTGRATPTDADITSVVQQAHALGLKVLYKPHVDLSKDRRHWRGDIGRGFTTASQWTAWFASYRAFIDHEAVLAQQLGVDEFAVGTELLGTTTRTADWRAVVADVRARYGGPLTYAAAGGNEDLKIAWWDAVDIIGVDAYYELTTITNPSPSQLRSAWAPIVTSLASLASRWNKKIIFTEIGYRSVDGTNMHPWDYTTRGAVDLQEQADCYTAAFDAVAGQSWFAGIYWWSWDTNPSAGGTNDAGYTPWKKPAGDILNAKY